MDRGARLLRLCVVSSAMLVPELVWACPSCAAQGDGGVAKWLVLGSMMFLPFAIVWVAVKGIKRLSPEAPHGRSDSTTKGSNS
jgi:hypothetical protein